jgi:hypothetical protein
MGRQGQRRNDQAQRCASQLSGRYPLAWRDYSDLGIPAGRFRYLWIPVSASGTEAR